MGKRTMAVIHDGQSMAAMRRRLAIAKVVTPALEG
jgi:hypothetical protein